MRVSSAVRSAVLCALALAAFPGAVQAAVTGSSVTAPASGAIIYDNDVPKFVTFAGTSTGDPGAPIDVRCFYQSPGAVFVEFIIANNVATDPGTGAWTIDVNVANVRPGACLVRAVDNDLAAVQTDLLAYAGPTVTFSQFQLTKVTSGPNIGEYFRWEVDAATTSARLYYSSPFNCALCQAELVSGANLRRSEDGFGYNNAMWGTAGYPNPTRNGLIIDGLYAYTPDGAQNATFNGPLGRNLPGWSGIDVTITPDAASGAISVVERMAMLRCNAGADQVTIPVTCTDLVSTGVHLQRKWRMEPSGRVMHATDTWTSTDGAAHTVKVQAFENFRAAGATTVFEFPWINAGAPAGFANGTVLANPPAAPWRAYMNSTSATDGGLQYPFGAQVHSSVPTQLMMVPSGAPESFLRTYELTVAPAPAQTVTESVYVLEASRAAAEAAATKVVDLWAKPTVTITSPTNGSEITSPSVVTGIATDTVGVASLTVNGAAATVGAGGAFSIPVSYSGPTTITAVAKDAAGNEATASVTVTFRAPPVDGTTGTEGTVDGTTGTEGNDTIRGNGLANVLNGLGGDDTMFCGAGGIDVANGGAGNDVIDCVEGYRVGQRHRDTVDCGEGTNDYAIVDPFDRVRGCERILRVWNGSPWRNAFTGTRANDRFVTFAGADSITCGGGNDTALAGPGNDVVNCRDFGTPAARKKSRDTVHCGRGASDVALVDPYDKVIGCERVVR